MITAALTGNATTASTLQTARTIAITGTEGSGTATSFNGDSGWQNVTKHPTVNKLPRYCRQVLCLIRNPSYGFNCTVLATKPLPEGFKSYGRLDISDKRVWWINFAYINNTQYFVTRAYFPTVFGKCMKFRIGWNIATAIQQNSYVGQRIKYCFTCNPFKSMQ